MYSSMNLRVVAVGLHVAYVELWDKVLKVVDVGTFIWLSVMVAACTYLNCHEMLIRL